MVQFSNTTQARVVSTASFANSLMLVSLFPYMTRMINDFNLVEGRSETGYYVWILLTSFYIARTLSSPVVGYIIDQKGRKNALIFALLSISIFSISFGFSEDIVWAAGSRFFLGAFATSPPITKTIIGEICATKELKTNSMSWSSLNSNFGRVTALFVGGMLAHPNELGLGWEEDCIFIVYPYLLPNLVVAACAAVSAIAIGLIYTETLNSAKVTDVGTAEYLDVISHHKVKQTITIFTMMVVCFNCLGKLQVLWFYSEKEYEGFQIDQHEIGMVLGFPALIVIALQHMGTEQLVKKLGYIRIIEFGFTLFAIQFVLLPLTYVFFDQKYLSFCIIGFFALLAYWANYILMMSTSVLVNNSVPAASRGKVNGLCIAIASLSVGTVSPFISIIYAFTTTSGYPFPLNHCASFLILACLSVASIFYARNIDRTLEDEANDGSSVQMSPNRQVSSLSISDR